jgi:hypothetical protein
MAAFLRGKGQILWDVTVNTSYIRPVNFLAPGLRDMFDANNKAVDYLYCSLCDSELERVQIEDLACRIWEQLQCSCQERSGSGSALCDLSERVRELHSSPK